MKSVYERTQLNITEFDREDVITTSAAVDPTDPTTPVTHQKLERENRYSTFSAFDNSPKNGWF